MEHPLGFDQVGQRHNGHGDQEITNDEKLGLVKRLGDVDLGLGPNRWALWSIAYGRSIRYDS